MPLELTLRENTGPSGFHSNKSILFVCECAVNIATISRLFMKSSCVGGYDNKYTDMTGIAAAFREISEHYQIDTVILYKNSYLFYIFAMI